MADLLDEYVESHGRDLIRFCTTLAGVAGRSIAVNALDGLSGRDVRSGAQVPHRAVLRAAVGDYLRGGYPCPAGTTPESWAAAVLASVEAVPSRELAWFVGAQVQPAQVDVVPVEADVIADDLVRRGRAVVVVRRKERRRRRTMLASAVALVVVLTAAAYAVVTHVTPPAKASGPGLINWTPRGDLLLDEDLRADAARVWKRSSGVKPRQVQTLWAGHVGDGRLVVLQGYDVDGIPYVAAIGEGRSGLTLLSSDAIDTQPDLLVIPYSGLRDFNELTFGDGGRVVRVLAEPFADLQRRALQVEALGGEDKLGPWVRMATHDGLTEPWYDLSGSFAVTAIRNHEQAWLVQDNGSLLPIRPTLVPEAAQLRAGATGIPDDAQVADDVLAIEQYALVPGVRVNLVWSGLLSSESALPARVYNLVAPSSCEDCDRGLWVVEGTHGIANPSKGGIVDGSLVLASDDYVELMGAPGSVVCVLSGSEVTRLDPAHLEAPPGEARSFLCRDSAGRVTSRGTV